MLYTIICAFLLSSGSFSSCHVYDVSSESRYEVGDEVKCSKWSDGESYWTGKVVKRIKTIYQVEIIEVYTKEAMKLYLNPSPCTGKKRLYYQDGSDYNKTKIWVAETCLD